MYNIIEIKNDLKSNLSEFRYNHSLLVAEEAKLLAHHYGLNESDAYIAGLVHDIAKEKNDDENVELVNKYNISNTFYEYKEVLHAEIGYFIVKNIYKFNDNICNAVRYHALGNIKMSLFDKVIFIADKIGRENLNDSLKKIKEIAYNDIDSAIVLCLRYQKEKLSKLNKKMHNDTIVLLNHLCSLS